MDTTDKTNELAADHVAYAAHHQAKMFLQGDPKGLEGFIIKSYELQQENDRLKEEVKLFAGGLEEQDARVTKFEAENDRLRLALSGKTGYDQVEVEMQRITTAIEERISTYNKEETDGVEFGYGDMYREEKQELHFALSLLSSPVSGEGKPTEI